ncbi:hypothetical protein F4553_003517 [Allocatelliglobosispora scoriae]|uniref:SRPBCC family protein n=1 Tax=Allocatelliglobosispora scoriae TaxID=643052 RepID=A0A841BRV8_9ACTN|nr:hypothetical protein [Allocatelliglobosispora scoriae]MBB5870138.1 hypothetical protein [Allocatelliglobosispora scoriae]
MLYVETTLRASLDDCWRATQDPAQHQRWDARFTRIDYLPFNGGQQVFEYATGVLPGLTIRGTGTTAGERVRPDGTRISVLRFASDHPLSLIRSGSGWWRYVPTADGLRFLTGYDYAPGWGRLGPSADRVFRPLMGWATAWSFDRLRIWLDHGVPPERTLLIALAEVAVRLLAVVLAALVGGFLPMLVAAAAGLLIPPSPVTPAARRCLRRPLDRRAATAPAALATLETP